MRAVSTTDFHFAISDAMCFRNASGVAGKVSTPSSWKRCLRSGAASAAFTSLFNRSMIARGNGMRVALAAGDFCVLPAALVDRSIEVADAARFLIVEAGRRRKERPT